MEMFAGEAEQVRAIEATEFRGWKLSSATVKGSGWAWFDCTTCGNGVLVRTVFAKAELAKRTKCPHTMAMKREAEERALADTAELAELNLSETELKEAHAVSEERTRTLAAALETVQSRRITLEERLGLRSVNQWRRGPFATKEDVQAVILETKST